MTKIVITPEDLGKGLTVEDRKVVVAVDNETVKIEDGVLKATAPVDVKLAGVEISKNEKTMTFTLSDGSTIKKDVADFLSVDTNTYPVRFEQAETVFNLALNDGTTIPLDLTEIVAELDDEIQDMGNAGRRYTDEKLADLKGEELQSLGGNHIGYLMAETQAV